jgi:hypothetical protein
MYFRFDEGDEAQHKGFLHTVDLLSFVEERQIGSDEIPNIAQLIWSAGRHTIDKECLERLGVLRSQEDDLEALNLYRGLCQKNQDQLYKTAMENSRLRRKIRRLKKQRRRH